MQHYIKTAFVIALCSTTTFVYAGSTIPAFVTEARELTITFQQALKQELMAAMQSGEPTKAVAVCRSRAPEIANKISSQAGWEIGRTSLKTRNQQNVPDDTERKVLEQFEQRRKDGEVLNKLEWWQKNQEAIAYMQAIPMHTMCANCHGSNVSPALKKYIGQFYPNDMATGFEVGDIRGAFTLKKYLGDVNGKAPE